MFVGDEFDILTATPTDYNHLPEEYKVLLGIDDMELIQMFETLRYLSLNDTNRLRLNSFVQDNLKSRHGFTLLKKEERSDVLNTYWDYLESINHENNRMIAFILQILAPKLTNYIKGNKFLFYSRKSAKILTYKIKTDQEKYADLIPASSFFEDTKSGGIQNSL